MKPYYQDNHITIYNKDCRAMDELADNSVQMVCCSPPYWGLRKYAGEQELIWGSSSPSKGERDCEHEWGEDRELSISYVQGNPEFARPHREHKNFTATTNTGSLCGAWKGAYGLEPTPEMYVQHTIEILREIRRVLRKDGVVFWNIGDSYYGSGQGAWDNPSDDVKEVYIPKVGELPKKKSRNLKPKDLCLIPFRVAIAAEEDGWWVRSVIIWSKPNPMPESVTDRPTESHEYILMLTKSSRYYWDMEAVREPNLPQSIERAKHAWKQHKTNDMVAIHNVDTDRMGERFVPEAGRNIRSVWEFPTQPYPEAHFAVFPEKLPETCIKASTPEVGCCSKCGAPWERIKEPDIGGTKGHSWHPHIDDLGEGNVKHQTGKEYATYKRGETLGWQPTCKCNADKVPSLVLDPFAGAGTTLWVAKKLNRRAVGYELSASYCSLIVDRCRQQAML